MENKTGLERVILKQEVGMSKSANQGFGGKKKKKVTICISAINFAQGISYEV